MVSSIWCKVRQFCCAVLGRQFMRHIHQSVAQIDKIRRRALFHNFISTKSNQKIHVNKKSIKMTFTTVKKAPMNVIDRLIKLQYTLNTKRNYRYTHE